MPLMNFSLVLTSPYLADRFDVLRREETVTNKGRSTVVITPHLNIIGVVTVGSPNDVRNGEDYQYQPRSLTIVTKFPVQGAVTGKQPDLIHWKGSLYRVTDLGPYPQFGEGFYQVECSSIHHTDPEFVAWNASPQLSFNLAANSGYPGVLFQC